MTSTADARSTPVVADARRNTAGTLAVTGAMVAFGVNNVIVRTTNFSGVVTASYRLFLGIALLVGFLWVTGRRPTIEAIRVAIPAGIAYGGSILFFFSAFKETSIANATLIAALQSGLSLTLVGRFFGEKVRIPEFVLTLVATGGVVLVILGGEAGGAGDIRGDLLAVGGTLSNTVYFVLGKRSRERSDVPAGAFQVGLLTVAAVMTIPVVLFSGEVPTPDGGDWLRLLALAVGGTLGHLGVNWAHRHVTLTTASLLTLAVPVVSSTVAWFVLDEYLSAMQWVGAGITLASLAAVVLRAVRPPADRYRVNAAA